MTENTTHIDYQTKWYFGGIAATSASIFTYPFEVIKTNLQIRRTHMSILQMYKNIVKIHGFKGLYNGMTANLMKHFSYSFIRFGLYETGTIQINSTPMRNKVGIAAIAGFIAGFIGNPATKINIRMSNDLILPKSKRRNYKHVLDGLRQIYLTEGIKGLYSGWLASAVRGSIMAISQIALYDELANELIRSGQDHNNPVTHFQAALLSGIVVTIVTEPFNVIRSRIMEGTANNTRGSWEIVWFTAKYSHHRFVKGFAPAFMQLVPQTILTFMYMEQLRIHFGERIIVENIPEIPSTDVK